VLAEQAELMMLHGKNAIHPGKGKQWAKLVRDTCEMLGLDEDEFLPTHMLRDKEKWGLK